MKKTKFLTGGKPKLFGQFKRYLNTTILLKSKPWIIREVYWFIMWVIIASLSWTNEQKINNQNPGLEIMLKFLYLYSMRVDITLLTNKNFVLWMRRGIKMAGSALFPIRSFSQ